MSQSNKLFFPNLDGLRFFAFFAVFINHAAHCLGYHNNNPTFNFIKTNFLGNGDMGVGFFFVLSGFLITYLLLEEKEKDNRINIRNFYLRRILRIWPLYFFIVALCVFVFPSFEKHFIANFPIGISIKDLNPLFYWTFTGNFDYIYSGITNFLIGVLWSVSIEEQFYLVWPLVIAFVPKKHLMTAFICIIIAAVYFRFYYANGRVVMLSYHSLSCMSDLAMGGVVAFLARKQQFVERIQRIPKIVIILIYCIGFILIPFRVHFWKLDFYFAYLAVSFAPVIFSAFFAFIILEQNYATHSVFKMNKLKWISSWGKFTYGMYCYHMIVFFLILFAIHLTGTKIIGMDKYLWMTVIVVSFFATLLVSKLSYRYLESPFLKIKNKFSPSFKKESIALPKPELPAGTKLTPVKISFIILVFILPFVFSYYKYQRESDLMVIENNKENIKRATYDSLITLARENIKKYEARKNFSLLSKAISLDPSNPTAYIDLGATYSMLHLYQKSIDACTRALKIDSTAVLAHGILKLSVAAKSKILAAIQEQEKINPKERDANFYNGYGFNHLMIGDFNKSIFIWKTALQNNSFNTMTLNNIGMAYMYEYKVDSALIYFKKAMQLEPRNPHLQKNLTWALETKARTEGAINK